MNEMTPEARLLLGKKFSDTHGEEENPPKFALATECHCAIDLSCRACDACGAGAGCWAWIFGGGLHSCFHPQPPIKTLKIIRTNQKEDTQRVLIITIVFGRKNDYDDQRQKKHTHSKNASNY